MSLDGADVRSGRIAGFAVALRTRYRSDHNGRRSPRVVRAITDVLVALLAVAVALSAVAVLSGGWQARPVLSGSMGSSLPVGSVALVQQVPAASVHVGDVLALHRPGASSVYVHRIVWLERNPSGLVIRTKGDANSADDPWTVIVSDRSVYKVRGHIPWLGYLSTSLARVGGGPLTLAGVACLLVGWAIWRSDKRTTRPVESQREPDKGPVLQ